MATDQHRRLLQRDSVLALQVGLLLVLVASALACMIGGFGWQPVVVSAIGWLLISRLIIRGLASHPHCRYGIANYVTTARAAATVWLAGLVPVAGYMREPAMQSWLWLITLVVLISLLLDGVDGYAARKTGLSSTFGARFDMEVDALLALVVALMLWRLQVAGIWVLALGLMRYVFVAASLFAPALQSALYPSWRRKAVCVVQVGVLCIMLAPVMPTPVSRWLGLSALGLLVWSFARDSRWLLTQSQARS